MYESSFQFLEKITVASFISQKNKTMETPEQYVNLFKVNNKGKKDNVIDVVWVFSLLTLIKIHNLFWYFL